MCTGGCAGEDHHVACEVQGRWGVGCGVVLEAVLLWSGLSWRGYVKGAWERAIAGPQQ